MRRTYKSKKEIGGALDHRDMLFAMDEKSSAFDAFYIQNIKQTVRELSSINTANHHGFTANKVRKRKYVKRIHKDIESTTHRESLAGSAFLTPDKSIRVNKVLDPFDQLLNTPSRNNDSLQVKKDNLFDKLQNKGKTYCRKKVPKIKKYSSSDTTDSDKENTIKDCKSQNLTDIGMHELVIEKDKKSSPKHFDESINNIVKNMSILKSPNARTNSIGKPKYLKYKKNRLTLNIQSPLLQNSPMCSTPFKEKYRGASIYNFSPISTKNNEDSPTFMPIYEENKEKYCNIYLKEQNDNKFLSQAQDIDVQVSPILMKTVNSIKKISPLANVSSSPIDYVSTFQSIKNKQDHHLVVEVPPDEALVPNCSLVNKKKSQENASNILPEIDNINNEDNISSIELSSFQITSEPFLGFSNNKSLDKSNVSNNNDSYVNNLKTSTPCEIFNIVDILSESDNDSKSEENKMSKSLCSVSSTSKDNTSLSSQENESMYDTCDSGELQDEDSRESLVHEPLVVLQRMNDSVFQKYFELMPNYDDREISENSFDNIDNDSKGSYQEYASLENDNSSNDHSCTSQNIDNNNLCEVNTETESEDSSDENTIDLNTNTEEERCISFVTTRRRNEVTNDSIFVLNDSYSSTSSIDCDKSVLSNTVRFEEKLKLDNMQNLPMAKDFLYEAKNSDNNKVIENRSCHSKYDESKISITTATKTESIRDSMSNVSLDGRKSNLQNKPSIVLQPGKKWERSLSIYRRITMVGSDHSLLEEEPLRTKGRKYRQSVISTIEMQDLSDSLHNESIISRRSTFVSKPNRCTIRIVKEANNPRLSVCSTGIEDLGGFLTEDCDDTIIELSKLSIADSEPEVTVLEHFHDTTGRVATARDYVLRRCNQTEAILFDECYPDPVLKNCRKIGEGVYGEVFLWRAGDGRARVMKIVPIAGTTKVNGEHQKDFNEIISEIVIAMELSALRAPIADIERHFDEGKDVEALDLHSVVNATDIFNEVLAVRCVYGGYPSRLLDLWELYDECKGSENDNPAILPVDQQYIVLELANAGQDLESYQFNSAEQAHALFLQVAFGLAVGEESFQFEHRDLHWGNVLIAPTDQKYATFVLGGRAHRVLRCGVAATIIDYSLSRLSLPLATDCAALYNDLAADESLFEAVGDYQFEVYRLMREKLGNDWKNFEPYTNILWLHYTVDKMITALRYKRTNTKIHKHYIAKLKGIKNRILEYRSAAQFVLTDNEF
ncbi:protein PF3D7_1417600 [Galleria mellonella]|uniref:non-specific serine/threonine protein kinase n=1 Tax=Galleria mellonella TaxID=7137 RepID=A0ABM3MTV0_GALME|nr:protein PF3D7_1417600 [Galleria mellonella]